MKKQIPTKLRLYRLIRNSQNPCSLTNLQLGKKLGIGTSTARQHLAELELDGVISRSYPSSNKRLIVASKPAKSYVW